MPPQEKPIFVATYSWTTHNQFAYPYLITCGYSIFLSNANSLCNCNNKPIISNQKTVLFSLNAFAVYCMNKINLIVFRATFNLIIWDYSGSLSKSNKIFKSRDKIWSSKTSLPSMKTFYESLDRLLSKHPNWFNRIIHQKSNHMYNNCRSPRYLHTKYIYLFGLHSVQPSYIMF